MQVRRRKASAYAGSIAAFMLWLIAGASIAAAGDKLTEQNMTQRDYQRLTATESSVEGESPEPPVAVHNFSAADEQAVTEEGGTKVISARDWKNESKVERDAHIRRIRSTMQQGARLVVTIPKGEVWLIPGTEPDERGEGVVNYIYILLVATNVIRPWSEAERTALPRTVARDKSVSHSDKHGTTPERAVQEQEQP